MTEHAQFHDPASAAGSDDLAIIMRGVTKIFGPDPQAALALLQRQRLRARPLSSDDPADAWLALLDGPAGRAM